MALLECGWGVSDADDTAEENQKAETNGGGQDSGAAGKAKSKTV
jgi:hypothetical protein